MIKNYLKIAWRNFSRNKFYSLINVIGLSVGLSCLILIALFVTDELSYDDFHQKSDEIHFVGREAEFGNKVSKGLSTPYPIGPTMKQEIPEVENYVVTLWPGAGDVSVGTQKPARENKILLASEAFFQVFSFPLIAGDPTTVLSTPNSVVLTKEMAEKYFPKQNPIGKTIRIDRYGDREYTISGIAENMKHNSYLNFDFVTSILENPSVEPNKDAWTASMFLSYVKVQENVKWKQIEPKIAELVETHIGENTKTTFFSIPLSQLYLSELVSADCSKPQKIPSKTTTNELESVN